MSTPRILPAGEAAVSVEFGDAIDPALNARVRALDAALAARPFPGFLEAIPTYRSLLVIFDPLSASHEETVRHLSGLAARASAAGIPPAPLKEVPTLYAGEDLEALARRCGLTVEDVVRLHSGTEYTVYMLGFSPGFAYMGMVPEPIAAPRLATPRTRVPAGSVGIAGRQTGVYPSATPGGWNLIGRSPIRLFDPGSDPPTFFQPGDRVRFIPVSDVEEPPPSGPESPPSGGEPVFEVLEAGLLTTTQDLGRPGYQRFGVPVSGAVDPPALAAANLLVGNPPGAAGLELTVAGPTLRLLRTSLLAVTGADLGATLERHDLGSWPVPPWTSFLARAGNILSFSGRRAGCRAYLAVAGGLDLPEVLGSRSTYLSSGMGGFCGRPLQPGDILRAGFSERSGSPGRRWPEELRPRLTSEATVRVVLGPQHDFFTGEAIETFLSAEYLVAPSSDRMGCRLEGPPLAHQGAREIVSDGTTLGSVQVPPDGRPIVMLADHGTTGGYPKIATVVGADIARVGQILPGERLRFRAVSLEEAREALAAARRLEEKGARAVGV